MLPSVSRYILPIGKTSLSRRCDKLWVYGEISDGVLAEIRMFKRLGKPIRFFDISKLPKEIKEISKDKLTFEDEVKEFADSI